mgnify:CR=1 FL=1
MPPIALALLIVAAGLHAGWNVLVKHAKEKQIFTWWALIVGSVGFAPVLLISQPFPSQIWPYVFFSALFEGTYYIMLTRAYQYGDFSLVYPIARGMAPAFLVIWALLFLGERPRLAGYIGLALLIIGLVIIGGKKWWSLRKITTVSTSGIALALSVACCISIYSAIDGAAVRLVAAVPYTLVVISLSAIFITPLILMRYGPRATIIEWRANWPRIAVVGVLMLLSYTLVLQSYTLARVSYAGAVREISVVFAALIGWRWLGEEFGLWRAIGASVIFTGILLIAIAG